MSSNITTKYDDEINAFVVRMPDFITFSDLSQWKADFLLALNGINEQNKAAILIDTNSHQFESIDCLKLLRELSREPKVSRCISRAAFVGPSEYREPEIIDDAEGYFSNFEEAYRWLS